MRYYFSFIFILVCFIFQAQDLISVEKLGQKSRLEVQREFPQIIFLYGNSYYKVRYSSLDAKGKKDTLSGLLAIPDKKQSEFPLLVYQHGTSSCKTCVPSRIGTTGGDEGEVGWLFSGLGYVTCLPDYVGMGDGRGFQTYVHASTLASATHDMVSAVKQYIDSQNDFSINEQLFITGYSQGGYASMAYQKYLEENVSRNSVTASAHLSGPYSLSGVMRDLILSDVPYLSVAYLPNTVLGLNEYYEFFKDISEFFKPEYVGDINRYVSGEWDIVQLNISLYIKLLTGTGSNITKRMIRDDVLEDIIANPDHPINKILKENDLHNWKPETPTAIFYCRADDQVPFMNSIVARDTMMAFGVENLVVRDVLSGANHGQCVDPALTAAIQFFRPFQMISTSTDNIVESTINVFPNPVRETVTIESENVRLNQVTICDVFGKLMCTSNHLNEYKFSQDVSNFPSGIYFVKISVDNQSIITQKIIIQ